MRRQRKVSFGGGFVISVLVFGISLTLIFSGEVKASTTIKPLLANDLVLTTSSTHPPANVAFDGQRYLTVWVELVDQSSYWGDIRGQFINPSGELYGEGFVITHNIGHEEAPAVAFNGTNYLITWCANGGVKARLVSPQGDLSPTEITIASSQDPQGHVDVASDGSNFLVVWFKWGGQNYDVNGQLVYADGSLSGTNFLIGDGGQWESYPCVAYGAGKFLVSWFNEPVANSSVRDIYGALIDSASGQQGTQFPISTAINQQGYKPRVAFGEENFLVVWDDFRASRLDVYAARVTPEGVVIEPEGIVISDQAGSGAPHFPNVAYNGQFWLVVWAGGQTKGARVSDDGVVLDPVAAPLYVSYVDSQWHPGIASGGNNFFITWRGWSSPYTKYAQLVGEISTNQPPTANAGIDQTVNEGEIVVLSVAWTDPDNDLLTYSWTQVPGTEVYLDLTDPVHPTFTAPGVPIGGETLTFTLTVSDGELEATDSVNITVRNVNHPPIADAGLDLRPNEESLVTLDGSGSYDSDSDELTYEWDQTAGPSVTLSDWQAVNPTFTTPLVDQAGAELTFQLTVSDGIDTAVDEVVVSVENLNHSPAANAGPDQTVAEGSSVTLNGSGSGDPDNDPLTSYQWQQVEGPDVSLDLTDPVHPTFVAPSVSAGGATLTFALTVYDGQRWSGEDQVIITIQNAYDPPLCAAAQAMPAQSWPPNHKMVPVKIVGVTDPDNDNVTITVTAVTQDEPVNGLGDGDTSPDAVVTGDDKLLLRAERAGNGNGRVYHVTFTADDGNGGTCSGMVTVCVPHDRKDANCTDDGALYNSLQP
jgi:hypothetical protein